MTPTEYLEHERAAELRSEFRNGTVFPRAGCDYAHNVISRNLTGEIWGQLEKSRCEVLGSQMRILVEATQMFAYPDLLIVCGEPRVTETNYQDTLTNPAVIFEIGSSETLDADLGDKWEQYQQIPTLTDYVLVWEDNVQVAHYVRQSPDQWLLTTFRRPDDAPRACRARRCHPAAVRHLRRRDVRTIGVKFVDYQMVQ